MSQELDDRRFQRYSRQTVLREVGVEGQLKLAQARVLVVGAGGLGSPILLYLAAAGLGLAAHGGCLAVIDADTVDLSNLQRQILFAEHDQGQPKVLAADQRLRALNQQLNFKSIHARLSAHNAIDLFGEYDIIVDGSDNFQTKYLINDVAVKLGKPVVFGSILGFEGQVSVFWAQKGPCYRCLYPAQAETYIPNCAEFGTMGGIAGLIGSVMAIEVCKLAMGLEHCAQHDVSLLIGQLWQVDARDMDVRSLTFSKKAACPVCSIQPDAIEIESDEQSACGFHGANETETLTLVSLSTLGKAGEDYILLDVREEDEWRLKRLPEAILFPLSQLISAIQQPNATSTSVLAGLKSSPLLLVHCGTGLRSERAVKLLQAQGFHAKNLIVDWTDPQIIHASA